MAIVDFPFGRGPEDGFQPGAALKAVAIRRVAAWPAPRE
jgi:hypothetical protein